MSDSIFNKPNTIVGFYSKKALVPIAGVYHFHKKKVVCAQPSESQVQKLSLFVTRLFRRLYKQYILNKYKVIQEDIRRTLSCFYYERIELLTCIE